MVAGMGRPHGWSVRDVMMSNKEKDLRQIQEDWTGESLFKLKRLAEQIHKDLYPGVITPMVEAEDVCGSYFEGVAPYTQIAAMPYLTWCIHK